MSRRQRSEKRDFDWPKTVETVNRLIEAGTTPDDFQYMRSGDNRLLVILLIHYCRRYNENLPAFSEEQFKFFVEELARMLSDGCYLLAIDSGIVELHRNSENVQWGTALAKTAVPGRKWSFIEGLRNSGLKVTLHEMPPGRYQSDFFHVQLSNASDS